MQMLRVVPRPLRRRLLMKFQMQLQHMHRQVRQQRQVLQFQLGHQSHLALVRVEQQE
jgi:phospholipid N-methyltransferase